MRISKKLPAFTLIELLISISIFMVFVGVAGGTYTSLVKANKQANDMQKLYGEVRFVLDSLATDIRSGELDFQCISVADRDPWCLQDMVLGIIKKNGTERVLYRFLASTHQLETLHQSRNDTRLLWSGSEWKPLFGASVPIQELSFNVFPTLNPYEQGNAEDDALQFQPAVTIALTAGNFNFQTTYTSRVYGRTLLYETLE